MLLRLTMIAGLFFLGACAGDEAKTEEPVAPVDTAVPDAPGGETAEKPAGEGKAGELAKDVKDKAKEAKVAVKEAAREATGEGGNGPMVVTSGALNVRSTNSMKTSTIVRTIQKGEKVEAKNCDKYWCEIGANEWVSKAHLAPQ